MRFRHCGITYMDLNTVKAMEKTEEGKAKLADIGDFQRVRWHTQNPVGKPNRRARRAPVRSPIYGIQHNNAQDRTRHKSF